MPVRVGGGDRVVEDVAVEVEGLGVFEVGVGDGLGGAGPIGGEEAAERGVVVAGAEVAEVGFRVEELAGEVDLAGAVLQVRGLAPRAAEVGFAERARGVGARAQCAQLVGVRPTEAPRGLGAEVAAAEIGLALQQVLVRVHHGGLLAGSAVYVFFYHATDRFVHPPALGVVGVAGGRAAVHRDQAVLGVVGGGVGAVVEQV